MLLCGMGIERCILPAPADAQAYHENVKRAAAQIPMRVGDWVGRDVPVPQAAVQMLSPNVILSRQYVDVTRGLDASVLLVQCGDARDMTAHYPPVCMGNAGWRLDRADPRRWTVGDLVVDGTDYEFSTRSFDRMDNLHIANFMVLPDGRIAPDMAMVTEAASDVRRRYFGSAQVQVVTGRQMTPDERDATFAALVGAMRDTIQAIRAGGRR
jgi:hypothetical protein